jgi:ubiquinone/menaquinone biosynthesis C-methylase UbiE
MIYDLFEKKSVLEVYDKILPLSEHYISILSNHLEALAICEDIIDLGCGTGILTMKYINEGKLVTAVDISPISLGQLRGKITSSVYSNNLKIIEADTTDLHMIDSNQYDGASSMIVAHLIANFDSHITEAFRILKPGGTFVITARQKGGDQSLLVNIVKDSLTKLSRYSELKVDFETLSKSLLMTANTRSVSLKSQSDVEDVLGRCGFVDIKNIPNKTLGVMYTLVAKKPKK